MNRTKTARTVALVLLAAALVWPAVRNYLATREINGFDVLEARLVKFHYTSGIVKLSSDQRKQLSELLHWEYSLFGVTPHSVLTGIFKGSRGCMEETIEVQVAGAHDRLLVIWPSCGIANFSGGVSVRSDSGVDSSKWMSFQNELFPPEPVRSGK